MDAEDTDTLALASKRFRHGLLALLKPLRTMCSLNDILVLCALPASKQKWLSDFTGLPSGSIHHSLKSLEAFGLIEPVLAGKTLSEWKITAKGEALLKLPTARQVEEATR